MKLFRAEEREAAEKREQEKALRDQVTQPVVRPTKWNRAEIIRKLREEAHFENGVLRRELLRQAADMLEQINPNGEFPSS